MYSYDEKFFYYTNQISARSAEVVVPLIYDELHPSSVLDLGCGCGVWLARWQQTGANDIVGIDGDYVASKDLVIPAESFIAGDLGQPVELGRKFDVAQSLEVAEHLPPSRAQGFVSDLCRHSDVVLFGAAPPGQGGEYHINEQPYDYWQGFFEDEGYEAYDFVRPRVLNRQEVTPWHRYNPVLYVRSSHANTLPDAIRSTRVPAGTPVPDLSPPLYRARKAVVRQLPPWATRALASARKRLAR
jgi:SAM-dependent methyltransferase